MAILRGYQTIDDFKVPLTAVKLVKESCPRMIESASSLAHRCCARSVHEYSGINFKSAFRKHILCLSMELLSSTYGYCIGDKASVSQAKY